MKDKKTDDVYKIMLVDGVEGKSIYLNDYRIAGNKPWGGGKTIAEWETSLPQINKAINLYQIIASALEKEKEYCPEHKDNGEAFKNMVNRRNECSSCKAKVYKNIGIDKAISVVAKLMGVGE